MYEKRHDHRPFLRHVHQIGVREDFRKPIVETCEPSRDDNHKKSNVACEAFRLDCPDNFTYLDMVLSALS